ncbi:hypothetical protein N0V95_005784 [Ascochyta clinopodiicola]|nr:hypothetical protein N0V95_005784 [Ascochyta clinopodiicola]
MAKKKSSKAALARPKISPYTSPPATVHFGVNCQPYYIPNVLLERLDNLPPHDPWTSHARHFKDTDPATGHLLIHYLHTGAYQTLSDAISEEVEGTENDLVIREFQNAVRVLDAATKHGLPGLQQLAQSEMERRGADMHLRDAVRAISEESIAGQLVESTWLRDYVAQKVRVAFEQDERVFLEPGFFEGVSSLALTKILAQSIVGLYSERVEELKREKVEVPPSEDAGRDSSSVTPDLTQLPHRRPTSVFGAQPKSSDESGAFGNAQNACDPQALDQSLPSSIPEADVPEPAAQPVKKKESSKKAAMLRMIAEHAQGESMEPSSTQELSTSVMQEPTDAVADSARVEIEEPSAPEETYQIPHAPVAEAPPEPAPELISDVPPVDPFAGLSKSQKMKLLKRAEREQRRLAEEEAQRLEQEQQEMELLRALEEEQAAQRAAEGEAAAAAAAALAEAEKERNELLWDDWGGAAVSSKKKKKKKGKESGSPPEVPVSSLPKPPPPAPEVEVVAEQPLPDDGFDPLVEPEVAIEQPLPDGFDPPPVEEIEDAWGSIAWGSVSTTKKSKKSKKIKKAVLDQDPPPPSIPEPEPAPESDLIEPYPVVEEAYKIPPPAPTIEISENEYCPLRSEHLSESDGWRTCQPCQSYMRKIALKLRAVEL